MYLSPPWFSTADACIAMDSTADQPQIQFFAWVGETIHGDRGEQDARWTAVGCMSRSPIRTIRIARKRDGLRILAGGLRGTVLLHHLRIVQADKQTSQFCTCWQAPFRMSRVALALIRICRAHHCVRQRETCRRAFAVGTVPSLTNIATHPRQSCSCVLDRRAIMLNQITAIDQLARGCRKAAGGRHQRACEQQQEKPHDSPICRDRFREGIEYCHGWTMGV